MKYKFEDIAFNSTEKKKPVESDKSHYIGLEHLDSQCLTVNRYGSDVAPIGEKLIMKKGDVLFGKRRAYQKKVAIAPFDGIFSAHGFVLRPKENVIDKNFFPFFISSDYFLDKAISISVGSLSPTINWSDLKVLEFELPDLEKQKRLAKILWEIEKYKNKNRDCLSLFQIFEESYLNEIFHKTCTYRKIGETCKFISGNAWPASEFNESIGIAILRIQNLTGTNEKMILCNTQPIDKFLVNNEDILLSLSGTIICTKWKGQKCYLNQRIVKIEQVNDIDKDYLLLFLNYIIDKIRESGKESLVNNISITNLKNFEIPILDKANLNKIKKFYYLSQNIKNSLQTTYETLNRISKHLLEDM